MNATNQNDEMDLPPLTCVAVVCREIPNLQAEKQIVQRIDDFIDYSTEFSFAEACYTSIALAKRVFIRSGRDQEELVTRIVSSASNGDLHELKMFRRVGRKVAGIRSRDLLNTQSFWGMLPAGSAAQGGYHRVLKWLVRKGANVDKKDSQGKTTFHWACEMGHLSMVKWLVDQGVKLDEKDSRGCTALHLAAGRGELSVAKYVLKTGAQANEKDDKGWTVLHYAARGGLLRLVLRLVKKGAAVDCIDSTGKTPLHVAVTCGHGNIARFLVENGACALSVDGFGHSALYYAMEWRGYELAEVMIEASNKTETSQIDMWEILLFAAAADQIGIIEHLRGALGVDVCISLRNGRTALHEAAKGGAPNTMQLLLERGLSITQADGFGTTPVIEACRQGQVEILHQALKAGGTIEDIDLAGRTPLHYAAESGHVDIVEALLERNADLNSCDKRHWTPLHCAAESGHEEVVNLLLAHEAPLDIKTIAGTTALNLAVERGHLNVVQILKEYASLHDISVNNSEEMLATTPTEYFLNPTDISFEASEFKDKGSGLWLGSPIEVKLKKSWSTNFVEEFGRWAQLNHPHVVKLFGVCYGDGVQDPCFVFERAIQGSLFEYLEKAEQRLTSAELWSKIFEAALGLQYLHDHGIVHCHFSCDSIVVAENGVAKLRNLSRDGEVQGSQLGVNAPEVVSGLPHSFQSDVYAFGLSIIQAVTASWNPWVANGKARGVTAVSHATMSRDTMILSGRLPTKPAEMNSIQWDLVCRMCSYNPHDRPSASDVVRELEAFTHQNTLQQDPISEKEKLFSNPLSRTSQDDETSVWSLLANVDDMCKSSTTTNEMNRDVYDRLVNVFKELKSMNGFSVKAIAHQFADIVRQFHHALERMNSEVLTEVISIGASRQLADDIFSVHKTLDIFIESAGLPESKLSKSWRTRWELHRTLQQEEALSTIENLSDLLESGGWTNDQKQTSQCLSYELSNLLASYDASSTTDKARITIIKDLFPNLENAPWFIPAYEVDFDHFDEFSHGAFGKVYHGKWKRSRVVVKKVELQNDSDQAAFLNEVEIWHKLYHPDIVQMFGACHVDNPFFLCEYAGGGQLDDYLRLHPDKVWEKLYEAGLGLRYLHVKRVVHRYLKCNNILIGNDGRAKLTDFGLSRLVANTIGSEEPESEEHGGDNPNVGAVRWKAPEVLCGEKATFASDVYSFGMCILEAVSGKFPWGMLDDLAVKYHVKHGSIPQRPPNCSEKAYKLVKRMCTYDPSARMEMKEVVNALDALRTMRYK